MNLDPQTIFSFIVGAPLLLMGGMGFTAAAGLYILDRAVRHARAGEMDKRPARRKERTASVVTLSPLSRRVTAEGVVENAPSMGLPSNKVGMWVFLASEIMFFTALIGTFVAYRVSGLMPQPAEGLDTLLAGLNTFLLIVSSFTLVLALESVRDGKINQFVLLLLATLVLGGSFLVLKGFEWSGLLAAGVTPKTSVFGTTFFVMTGFHGAHVAVGLVWLMLILLKSFRGDFSRENNLGIEVFGLYWHFVDIVWIILFTIIYLMGS